MKYLVEAGNKDQYGSVNKSGQLKSRMIQSDISLSSSATLDEVMAVLNMQGYCIIEKLVTENVMDAVNAEMAPFVDKVKDKNTAEHSSGLHIHRCGALIARSPSSHQLIQHPLVLAAANRWLGRNASVFQLNLTQIIRIAPKGKPQGLHRDEAAWDFYQFPLDYEVGLNSMWALDDFTEENGATRVVPESHISHRNPSSYTYADTLPAEMPKGSLMIWSGKLVHGGGANKSKSARRGLNIDYCVGWVRQEENQYLSVPVKVARSLDDSLLKLMGYQRGGGMVGYVRDFEEPLVALNPNEHIPVCFD